MNVLLSTPPPGFPSRAKKTHVDLLLKNKDGQPQSVFFYREISIISTGPGKLNMYKHVSFLLVNMRCFFRARAVSIQFQIMPIDKAVLDFPVDAKC